SVSAESAPAPASAAASAQGSTRRQAVRLGRSAFRFCVMGGAILPARGRASSGPANPARGSSAEDARLPVALAGGRAVAEQALVQLLDAVHQLVDLVLRLLAEAVVVGALLVHLDVEVLETLFHVAQLVAATGE